MKEFYDTIIAHPGLSIILAIYFYALVDASSIKFPKKEDKDDFKFKR